MQVTSWDEEHRCLPLLQTPVSRLHAIHQDQTPVQGFQKQGFGFYYKLKKQTKRRLQNVTLCEVLESMSNQLKSNKRMLSMTAKKLSH